MAPSVDAAGPDADALELLLAALADWLVAMVDAPTEAVGPAAAFVDAVDGVRARAESKHVRSRLDLVCELAAAHASLVEPLARRAVRFAFDLHDGAIQDVAAAGFTLQLVRNEAGKLPPAAAERLNERVDAVYARLEALERELRELAHSFERPSLAEVPLDTAVRRVVDGFAEDSGIRVDLRVDGSPEGTTASQRIAIVRILQGALANVRKHAEASRVEVALVAEDGTLALTVEDDGKGFDVDASLQDAAERDRLGFVAMRERVRLLGGRFEVESRPGGPSRIVVALDGRRA